MHESFSFKAWITRHWTTLLIVIVLIASFAYRYSAQKKKANEDLFFKDEIYSKWLKEPTNNEYFAELNKILDRNKDLHKIFDGVIAQKLIEIGQFEKVKIYSKLPLRYLNGEFPFFALFVENSILIAEKKYDLALKKSYELNDKIENVNGSLKIFNLLRISLLEKALDHKHDEYAALVKLKKILQNNVKNLTFEKEEVMNYTNKRIKLLEK
jgi:hypothetical protein